MTMFFNEMLECLIIAAGIGGAVGWLLRHVSAGRLAQQLTDVTAMMRLKEQMLEKARNELRGTASEMQELESQMGASEALIQSNQEELSLRQGRIQTLQEELATGQQRLAALEFGQTKLLARVSDSNAETIAQTEKIRQSKATREAAQQALDLKNEELRSMQERLALLETQCADTDRLRTRVQELEATAGRVHWLEGQLSERDVQHHNALHNVELQLTERDRRIGELEILQLQLKKQAEDNDALIAAYTQGATQQSDQAA